MLKLIGKMSNRITKKKKSIVVFADYFISGMLNHVKIMNHLLLHQLDIFSASYAEERGISTYGASAVANLT